MQFVQLGPLGAVITPVLPPAEIKKTIVLLHGYGAPGTDLVGLAPALQAPTGTRFVFLQAPLLLDPHAPPSEAGRAWWPIDMMRLQTLRMSGQYETLAKSTPPGLDQARALLDEALDVLFAEHGGDPEQLVLGGFSQGSMLSVDFALRTKRPLAGLIVLSGTALCESEWLAGLKERAPLPVFQSHSPDDQVLPFALAQRLGEHFRAAGYPHLFVEFPGGHGISPQVLQGLRQFLGQVL